MKTWLPDEISILRFRNNVKVDYDTVFSYEEQFPEELFMKIRHCKEVSTVTKIIDNDEFELNLPNKSIRPC